MVATERPFYVVRFDRDKTPVEVYGSLFNKESYRFPEEAGRRADSLNTMLTRRPETQWRVAVKKDGKYCIEKPGELVIMHVEWGTGRFIGGLVESLPTTDKSTVNLVTFYETNPAHVASNILNLKHGSNDGRWKPCSAWDKDTRFINHPNSSSHNPADNPHAAIDSGYEAAVYAGVQVRQPLFVESHNL